MEVEVKWGSPPPHPSSFENGKNNTGKLYIYYFEVNISEILFRFCDSINDFHEMVKFLAIFEVRKVSNSLPIWICHISFLKHVIWRFQNFEI